MGTTTPNNKTASSEDIEPGSINETRTKCRCYFCEETMPFHPSWNAETTCPKCEETMFCYTCHGCSNQNQGPSEPSFPNQPCGSCGTTREEEEKEEKRNEAKRVEERRVGRAASFRKAKKEGLYRNNINRTYEGGTDPTSESDALRMHEQDWNLIRPFIVQELEAQNLSIVQTLTVNWCQHQISFFERSWQDENIDALLCGYWNDTTGNRHILSQSRHFGVRLRELRENHAECSGTWPTCPAVTLDEKRVVKWGENTHEDLREVWRDDGNTRLTLFEFLIWSARVGGLGGQDYNDMWMVPSDEPSDERTPEPIAYVPTCWTGKPKAWAEQRRTQFGRWFWYSEQESDALPWDELVRQSERNMQACHVCLAYPTNELILCECGTVYYCSEKCEMEYWEVHILDPNCRHENVERTCLGCGVTSTALKRCSKCCNAWFCDKDCQKMVWSDHKKQCVAVG